MKRVLLEEDPEIELSVLEAMAKERLVTLLPDRKVKDEIDQDDGDDDKKEDEEIQEEDIIIEDYELEEEEEDMKAVTWELA